MAEGIYGMFGNMEPAEPMNVDDHPLNKGHPLSKMEIDAGVISAAQTQQENKVDYRRKLTNQPKIQRDN